MTDVGGEEGLTLDKRTMDVLVANIIPTSRYFEVRFDYMQSQIDDIKGDIKDFRGDLGRRFDEVKADMERRFDGVKADMDNRFEQVDKRLEQIIASIDRQNKEAAESVLNKLLNRKRPVWSVRSRRGRRSHGKIREKLWFFSVRAAFQPRQKAAHTGTALWETGGL